MESSYGLIESRIQEALRYLSENPRTKITVLGKQFNVPYQRLLARLHGRKSISEVTQRTTRLNEFQEAAVLNYVERLTSAFIPPRKDVVVAYANSLLNDTAEPGVPIQPLGPQWLARFLRRHPDLTATKMKTMEKKRQQAADVEYIRDWFAKYEKVRRDYQIQSNDIWNMDESGFQIGQGRSQVVIIPRTSHIRYASKPRLGVPENRESVTVIEAISSTGNYIAPWLLMCGKNHVATTYGCGTMLPPNDAGVNGIEAPADWSNDFHVYMTKSGFTNDEIAIEWLQHFNEQTSKCQQGAYRLLLVDQHGSHCTQEFIDYCNSNNIVLFGFVPHSTHFIQPCDVGIFGPYKHYFAKAVNEAACLGYTSLAKYEFIHMLATARRQAMKPSNITSAFKRAGLEPIDIQVTINVALSSLPPAPITPPRRQISRVRTPRTVKSTNRQGQWLLDCADDFTSIREDYKSRLATYIRGTSLQSHALRQTMFDLNRTNTAQAAQNRARS